MPSSFTCLVIVVALTAVTEDEKEILARREAVRSYELKLDIASSHGDSEGTYHYASHIWSDGTRLREDRILGSDPGAIRQVRCFDGTDLIYWNTDHPDFAVHRFRSQELPRMRADETYWFPLNPGLLGLVLDRSIELRQGMTVSDFVFSVGCKERQDVQTRPITLEDKAANEIQFRTSMNVPFRIVSRAEPPQGPVLLEIPGVNRSLRTEYQLHSASKSWFPRKVIYHSEFSPQTRVHDEVLVEIVKLNEAIDPKTFTFSGMDIPGGQAIVSSPRDDFQSVWNGKEEVRTERKRRAKE